MKLYWSRNASYMGQFQVVFGFTIQEGVMTIRYEMFCDDHFEFPRVWKLVLNGVEYTSGSPDALQLQCEEDWANQQA